MNSEEGISLAKMAVAVLLVVLVIGAVVAIVYAAYSWFNGGTEKLGDQVSSIGASAYSQYDDVQVTGNDVLSALKTFRDADFAVVICNKNNYTDKKIFNPSEPKDVTGTAYNYCAYLANDDTKKNDNNSDNADASKGEQTVGIGKSQRIYFDESAGHFLTKNLLYSTSGTAVKNTNFSPTTDSSNSDQFVRTTGTFYSKLLYSSETGDACGVIFFQVE